MIVGDDRATALLGASSLLSLLHSVIMLVRSRRLKSSHTPMQASSLREDEEARCVDRNRDGVGDGDNSIATAVANDDDGDGDGGNNDGGDGDNDSAYHNRAESSRPSQSLLSSSSSSSLSIIDIMKIMTLISYAALLFTWCFYFKAFGKSEFSVFVFLMALNWTVIRIPVSIAVLMLGKEFVYIRGVQSALFSIFCYFLEFVAVAYSIWEHALTAYETFQYDEFTFYLVLLKVCVCSNLCLVFWFKIIVKQWNKSYLLITAKNLIESKEFDIGLKEYRTFSLQVWFGWFASRVLRRQSIEHSDLFLLPSFLTSRFSAKEMILCSKTYTSALERNSNNNSKIENYIGEEDDEDEDEEETIFFNSHNPFFKKKYFDQEIDLDAIRRGSKHYSKVAKSADTIADSGPTPLSAYSSSSLPSLSSPSLFAWRSVSWLRLSSKASSIFSSNNSSSSVAAYSLYPLIALGLSVHASSLLSLGIIKLLTLLLSFAGPLLLGELVYFLQTSQDSSKSTETLLSEGMFLVLLLALSQLAMATLNALYSFRCNLISMKLKGSLLLLTFGKAVSIPAHGNAELSEVVQANVMNIAQVDIDRVSGIFQSINDLWAVPLQIIIAFMLLYSQVRIAFLAGVAIILIMLPLNSIVAAKIGHFTKLLMQHKDARIKLLTEAINSMKSVKMLGLESVVKNLSGAHRISEITYLGYRKYLDAVCVLLWASMPVLVPYITFMVTTAIGQSVDAPKVFTTIALINMLIFPMNALPWIINGFMENLVSLRRVGNLLMSSDGSQVSITDCGILGDGIDPKAGARPNPSELGNKNSTPVVDTNPSPIVAVGVRANSNPNPLFVSKRKASLAPTSPNATSSNRLSDESNFGVSADFFDMPFTLTAAKWAAPPRLGLGLGLENTSPSSLDANKLAVSPENNENISNQQESFDQASDTMSSVSDAFDRVRSGSQKTRWKRLVEPKPDTFVVGPVDLECRSGSVTAVLGPVACGKSAFLMAILGEFRQIKESTSMITDISASEHSLSAARLSMLSGGSSGESWRSISTGSGGGGGGGGTPMVFPKYSTVDYCSQIPALHSDYSIQENIVFGSPYKAERYKLIVNGCCLDKDFELGSALQGGGGITSKTILSQNAQNLSGGQRLRVGVARALYSRSKVVLLDDPFSALDRATSLALMKFIQYIASAEGRTIILTTHSLFLMSMFDQVVVMKDGEVTSQGTSSEVAATDPFLIDGMKTIIDKSRAVHDDKESIVSTATSATISNATSASTAPSTSTSSLSVPTVDFVEDNGAEILLRGKISSSVIWYYIKAVGMAFSLGTILSILLMQLSSNALFYWLAYWVSHQDNFSKTEFVSITSLIVLSNFCFAIFRSFLFAEGGLKGARNIYNALVTSLMSVNIEFYERFNTGKIVNRIGKDTNTIDDQLPFMVNIVLAQSFQILGSCLIIGITDPLVIAVLLLVFVIYYRLQVFYRRSSRQLRRLESNSRSPVYAIIGDCSANGPSIRAMDRIAHFNRLLQSKVDYMLTVTLNVCIAQQWLSIRLQSLGVVITTTLALSAILCSVFRVLPVSPALLGLSISYSLTIVNNLNGLVGSTSETEQEMISVERVYEYSFMRSGSSGKPRQDARSASRSSRNSEDPEAGLLDKGDNAIKEPLLGEGDENKDKSYEVKLGDSNPFNEPSNFLNDNDDDADSSSSSTSFQVTKIRTADLNRLDYAIDIVAEGLSFYYSGCNGNPALSDVNFTIPSGNRVAVTGRTGSGKSTLIRCLLGLSCNSYSGSLKISGLELRDFTKEQLDALRQAISVVPQDPLIFSGTLKFNLDPKGVYSEQELLQVIARTKLSNALTHNAFGDSSRGGNGFSNDGVSNGSSTSGGGRFEDNFPLLNFSIADAGQSLSVGQKQLICVARVLLKRSKLIIIDEATSSVDSVAEKHIYETLCRHAINTSATVLCVCHKLESVKNLCESQLELDRGHIVRLSKI